jgi:exosortase/archaeosortase family protein
LLSDQSTAQLPRQLSGFVFRIALLALLLAIELITITVWLDNSALIGSQGLVGFVGQWGAWILRALVGFAALFVTFAWLKHRDALETVSGAISDSPVGLALLAGHVGLIAIFGLLSSLLYGSDPSALVASGWLASGMAAIAMAGFAFIRPVFWLRIAWLTGSLWLWALAAVLLACISGNSMRSLWPWTVDLTFRMARLLLTPFVPVLVADPSKALLGTPRFSVEIAPQCSGLEGIALMLAFGILWLGLFRRECRFPHVLVLLPAGVAVIFFLNSVRIASLILIGNAGAERIAVGGFHSQAGWIIFNLVALGFSVAALRIPWIRSTNAAAVEPDSFDNPSTTWLLPWLGILAAGILSHAVSADFEWLYPLRLFDYARRAAAPICRAKT